MSNLIDDYLEDVRAIINERGIVNLVESGTGPSSSGLAIAERFGLKGYTCDVYWPCVRAAAERHPTMLCHHGESLGFFRELFKMLDGPTFFWLDGHCPTDPDCLDCPVFPPFDEVQLIKLYKRGYEQDVIWLDDFPMVTTPDNPIASSWDVLLNKHGGPIQWRGETSHTFAEYETILGATHSMSIVGPVVRYTPCS